METKKFSLPQLRNNQHFQFHIEIKEQVTSFDALKDYIKKQIDDYIGFFGLEDGVMKKIRKSAITVDINEADKKRNTVFRGVVHAFQAALSHFDSGTVAAANRLQIVFDAYGDISKMAMDDKSSAIYNFVNELTDNHSADMEKAGLAAWIAELDKSNEALRELVRSRNNELAARNKTAVKKVRADVDEAYRIIMLCVDALWIMAQTDQFRASIGEFIQRVNTVVEHYSSLLARRNSQSGSKNADDAGDTSADGETEE